MTVHGGACTFIVMQNGDPADVHDGDRVALRIEEVARRLDVSTRHVYNLFKAGKLRYVVLGGRRVVLPSALEEFIESLESGVNA